MNMKQKNTNIKYIECLFLTDKEATNDSIGIEGVSALSDTNT